MIQETAPAEGFDEDMVIAAYSEASGTVVGEDLLSNDTAFVLKIPAKSKTTRLDKVKVTNKRSVKVKLNVEKLLTSYSTQEFTFKFDLKLTDKDLSNTLKELNATVLAKDPIETVTLTIPARTTNETNKQRVYGSFADVTLYGAGTYYFTITEQEKTNGDENEDPTKITYDTEAKEVKVVVAWHEKDATHDKAGLYVDSITYKNPDEHDSQVYELIENSYTPEPVDYTPHVKKQMSTDSKPLPEAKTFNFTMTADPSNPAGATINKKADNTDGSKASVTLQPGETVSSVADFGSITFNMTGVYTFTFAEDTYNYPGMTPATTTPASMVIEIDDNGDLYVKSVTKNGEYVDTDEELVFTALFTNKYVPTPVEYQPHVKKLMSSDSNPLPEATTFNFTMIPGANNPPDGAVIH